MFACHVWQSLGDIGNGFSGAVCSVFQIARDAAQAKVQQVWAQQAHYPADYAQWLTQPMGTHC
ncbi:MAG: hypothetical protein H7240_01430 [Glaciimonas sp.]|nr:hypothetical protein [Glaciimonas sp.]